MQQRGVHLSWANTHQGKAHCGQYSLVILPSVEAGISSAVWVSDSVGISVNLYVPLHFLISSPYPPVDLNIGRKHWQETIYTNTMYIACFTL